MRGVKGSRKPVFAVCHPLKKNRARGLCTSCWRKQQPIRMALCHPTKPIHGQGRCKNCYDRLLKTVNPDYAAKQAANRDQWHERTKHNPTRKLRAKARAHLYYLARTYGMSLESYRQFIAAHSTCDICRQSKTLVIDHDHTTGKIRGALCHHCNILLGNAKDDTAILQAAIQYLKTHDNEGDANLVCY